MIDTYLDINVRLKERYVSGNNFFFKIKVIDRYMYLDLYLKIIDRYTYLEGNMYLDIDFRIIPRYTYLSIILELISRYIFTCTNMYLSITVMTVVRHIIFI